MARGHRPLLAHDFPGQVEYAIAQLGHVTAVMLVSGPEGCVRVWLNADAEDSHRLRDAHLAEILVLVASRREW